MSSNLTVDTSSRLLYNANAQYPDIDSFLRLNYSSSDCQAQGVLVPDISWNSAQSPHVLPSSKDFTPNECKAYDPLLSSYTSATMEEMLLAVETPVFNAFLGDAPAAPAFADDCFYGVLPFAVRDGELLLDERHDLPSSTPVPLTFVDPYFLDTHPDFGESITDDEDSSLENSDSDSLFSFADISSNDVGDLEESDDEFEEIIIGEIARAVHDVASMHTESEDPEDDEGKSMEIRLMKDITRNDRDNDSSSLSPDELDYPDLDEYERYEHWRNASAAFVYAVADDVQCDIHSLDKEVHDEPMLDVHGVSEDDESGEDSDDGVEVLDDGAAPTIPVLEEYDEPIHDDRARDTAESVTFDVAGWKTLGGASGERNDESTAGENADNVTAIPAEPISACNNDTESHSERFLCVDGGQATPNLAHGAISDLELEEGELMEAETDDESSDTSEEGEISEDDGNSDDEDSDGEDSDGGDSDGGDSDGGDSDDEDGGDVLAGCYPLQPDDDFVVAEEMWADATMPVKRSRDELEDFDEGKNPKRRRQSPVYHTDVAEATAFIAAVTSVGYHQSDVLDEMCIVTVPSSFRSICVSSD